MDTLKYATTIQCTNEIHMSWAGSGMEGAHFPHHQYHASHAPHVGRSLHHFEHAIGKDFHRFEHGMDAFGRRIVDAYHSMEHAVESTANTFYVPHGVLF